MFVGRVFRQTARKEEMKERDAPVRLFLPAGALCSKKVVFKHPVLNGALKRAECFVKQEGRTKIAECVALRRRKERS